MVHLKRLFGLVLALSYLTALDPLQSNAHGQQAEGARVETAALPYFSEPSLSPDREEIAFVSGGDIWTVPVGGGEARLLVAHQATEFRPVYAPDGGRLAFTSNRTGNGDVYVLTFATGDLRRMTFDDGFDQIDAWSRDGRWLYFSSTTRDIAGMNDIYRVSSGGGTPMLVSADRYTNEYFSTPSPDGATLALTVRAVASSQWWRKGHSHIDESEVWLMREASSSGATPVYESVTNGGAKELWPMWGADGRSLFYVSDRSGAQNIWSRTPGGQPRQITNFNDGRVLWPSISYDGKLIVFERDFRIWRMDATSGQAKAVNITRRGASPAPAVERLRLSDQIQELALAPDGKKVAFVVRGEIFAASATDGGEATRVTNSPANDNQIAWSPDSRRLAYASARDGAAHLYLYDFANGAETQLTNTTQADAVPSFSPDGKLLAFERAGVELRVLNLDNRQERVLATANLERPPFNSDRSLVWSPDGRWIAFMPVSTTMLFRNISVVAVDGGETRPVSFLSNLGSNTISWSPDGTFLLIDSGQRTEDFQLARIDLMPRTPRFREDQFRDLFREETPRTVSPTLRRQDNAPAVPERDAPPNAPTPTPAVVTPSPTPSPSPNADEQSRTAKKPVEIDFDEIRRRLSLLPVGVDVNYQAISPDGKWVLMIASAVNQQNLYVYSLDELAREPAVTRQLTSTPGQKSFAQFSPDSKEIFYLDNGRIQITPLDARQPGRPLAVVAEMDVDFAREKMEIFRQAWSYMRDNFYDPNFHGANWTAVRAEYEPQVAGARTPDEVRRILQLMVGELNASHLGVSPPPGGAPQTVGKTGLRFDRVEYERNGLWRVTEVIPLSPAALRGDIKPGDYLVAVDGKLLTAQTNFDELLNNKINRRLVLTVTATADGANRREVVIRPVNTATEKALLYRAWVENNRAYVARVSNGRLGYAHMFDMSSASLQQLYVDLDAENYGRDGVVIDIRNNNGGFVNVYAIDVLARRSYLSMTPRGFTSAPARSVLGQRALELPTILVTNQHSLSDAEDFTEGYRALKLGKVVGQPTAGWIIFTWNVQLIDGSTFRLPRMRVDASDGTNMELNPRPVDVNVKRPVGETYALRDSQLDAAVRELLKQIGSK